MSQEFDASTDMMMNEDNPLDKVVLYALDEARQRLEQGGSLEPLTVVLKGDDLYVENHPGETVQECFESAKRAIHLMQDMADAYVFCYDGYVGLDEGERDAVLAERGIKGEESGMAFAMLYTEDEDSITFDEDVYVLGEVELMFGEGYDEGSADDVAGGSDAEPEAGVPSEAQGD